MTRKGLKGVSYERNSSEMISSQSASVLTSWTSRGIVNQQLPVCRVSFCCRGCDCEAMETEGSVRCGGDKIKAIKE